MIARWKPRCRHSSDGWIPVGVEKTHVRDALATCRERIADEIDGDVDIASPGLLMAHAADYVLKEAAKRFSNPGGRFTLASLSPERYEDVIRFAFSLKYRNTP